MLLCSHFSLFLCLEYSIVLKTNKKQTNKQTNKNRNSNFLTYLFNDKNSVSVCVCVCERERERERDHACVSVLFVKSRSTYQNGVNN